MFFSYENRDLRGFALLGSLIIAVVLAVVVAACGSLYYSFDFWPLFVWSVVGVMSLCFLLAVAGLTVALAFVGIIPWIVVDAAEKVG